MKSWGLSENLCMLAALMPMMSEEQWDWFTMGNTMDVRAVVKKALELKDDHIFEHGISAKDIYRVFIYVVMENEKRGIKLGFVWSRVRPTGGFQVSRMREFLLSRKGRYVLLGKAKDRSDEWEKLMKRLKREKEEDVQLMLYAKTSDKVSKKRIDHAMGLHVEDDKMSCFNNGYTRGMMPYTVLSIASQMESINEGYYVDLFKLYG
jgi:hypothetical protein